MSAILDNVFWHALSGAQRSFSLGNDLVRRFAPGFGPFVAFPDPSQPDFDALMRFSSPREALFCPAVHGALPEGWRQRFETTIIKMVWSSTDMPAALPLDARPLGAGDAQQAVDLAALTRPGPVGLRTLELGDYFGCFEGPRLIAMAGERVWAPPFREVSGICTHPDYQGRGLARALSTLVIRRMLERGETPFLHVVHDNTARPFYERLGFRDYHEIPVRIVSHG